MNEVDGGLAPDVDEVDGGLAPDVDEVDGELAPDVSGIDDVFVPKVDELSGGTMADPDVINGRIGNEVLVLVDGSVGASYVDEILFNRHSLRRRWPTLMPRSVQSHPAAASGFFC